MLYHENNQNGGFRGKDILLQRPTVSACWNYWATPLFKVVPVLVLYIQQSNSTKQMQTFCMYSLNKEDQISCSMQVL